MCRCDGVLSEQHMVWIVLLKCVWHMKNQQETEDETSACETHEDWSDQDKRFILSKIDHNWRLSKNKHGINYWK